MRMNILLGIAIIFLGTVPARAAHCPWKAYSPDFVRDQIRFELAQREISVVPPVHLGIKGDADLVLRKNGTIGSLWFHHSTQEGVSELILSDPHNQNLLTLTETRGPCPSLGPVGRCTVITMNSQFDESEETPDFQLNLTPAGNHFYRFGRKQNPVIWRAEFTETVRWAVSTLDEQEAILRKEFLGQKGALLLSLASDPFLVPYFDYFHYHFADGFLVFTGAVPSNFVYGRVLDRAREAGFYSVRMDVIIDTRIQGPDVLLPPILHCHE